MPLSYYFPLDGLGGAMAWPSNNPKKTAHKKTACGLLLYEEEELLPPLSKLIGAEPTGTSNSLISLTDLTLNTTVLKKAKQTSDKVSPTYVIKKKTEIKAPSVLESCSDKNADSSTKQVLLTLME
ncbi:hypothetical protein Tco_1368938 [Tanacetum coccineum]